MRPRVLANLTDNKSGPLAKVPLVELSGQNRVLVENHNGILAYSLEEIRVKVAYGTLVVKGKKLRMLQLNSEQLVIAGVIDALFPVGGNE